MNHYILYSLLAWWVPKTCLSNRFVENYWTLVPALILPFISPLITWRLSRPDTAIWFKFVTSQEARKRHRGLWVWWIALWSIIGGRLVALGAFH